MIQISKITAAFALMAGIVCISSAQIPDLLNAFDAGGRALGMGGALHGNDPSSMSAYYNPATLGYISKAEVDLALHNLSNSTTLISGSKANPTYSTDGHSGSKALTDFGVAIPVKALIGGGKASIALNYNVGGYVHDVATGPVAGLPDGALTVQNYRRLESIRTDFLTLAYGQSTTSKTFAFGAGVVYAQNAFADQESGISFDSSGDQTPFSGTDANYQSHGWGGILGLQVIPNFSPNLSLGVSVRSPIDLDSGSTPAMYDRVPGRVLADISYRVPGFGGSSDYAILAAQYEYFFGGDPSPEVDIRDQDVYGIGIEYDKEFSKFRIPIRIGYQSATAGGLGFASSQAITYGIGFRPSDSKFSLDLNWTTATGGGKDFGISAGYRFGK